MNTKPAETLPKPTLALFTEGRGGYGHRLFLPAHTVFWDAYDAGQRELLAASSQAHETLKRLCVWGGHDKSWRINGHLHHGYEFNTDKWDEILVQLGEAGITFYVHHDSLTIEAVN